MQRFPRFGGGLPPPYLPDDIEQDAQREDPTWNQGFVDAPDAPPQQPPPMPSMKRDSMVAIDDGPEMAPGMVGVTQQQMRAPEPVTAPPPEHPIARYQRELDALKAPERGPVSKWAKLAAIGLGAGHDLSTTAEPSTNLRWGRSTLKTWPSTTASARTSANG